MNCIFICIFNQEKYVDMLFLLLESISLYGNINNNTHILIYTCTHFMNLIKASIFFNKNIIFEINDSYNNIDLACKSRLDLFDLLSIVNYKKILYLDTDIIVKDDINKLFNLDMDDILYVLEEWQLTDNNNWYGGISLFGDEINNYIDKSAFTSGILLFNNCITIKNLFNIIKQDIIDRPFFFTCYDQPYFVYNAFKYNLFNNKILKSFVVNFDTNFNSDKVIHHFPGYTGIFSHKIDQMTVFLNNLKRLSSKITSGEITRSEIPSEITRSEITSDKITSDKITPILFQTSKHKMDDYIYEMIQLQLGNDWKYEYYNDDNIIQFFQDNPIDGLENIIYKYNSFTIGPHKANIFTYYYLYIKGGVYMDSDAMIYHPIKNIVKNYHFISVNSSCHPGTIFQGILGACPKNKIIKNALFNAYNTDNSILLMQYHYFCRELYDIIQKDNFGYNIKLYNEQRINDSLGDNIFNNSNTLLFKHYWKYKIIPTFL